MRVLDASVTRRPRPSDIIGPARRVDVITVLKAMTLWPAWQHFEEGTKGSIEGGKLADFVILSKDPTAIDPELSFDSPGCQQSKSLTYQGLRARKLGVCDPDDCHFRGGRFQELPFRVAVSPRPRALPGCL